MILETIILVGALLPAAAKGERIAKSPLLGQIDDSGIDQLYKNCIISQFQWEMSKFYKNKLLYNIFKGFPHFMIFLALELNISQYNLLSIIVMRFLKCKMKFFDHITAFLGSSLS